MATIKVTAGDGRTVPLHPTVATAPGAQMKMLVAPEVIEVDDSHLLVQRALRDGDLVRVGAIKPGEAVTKEAVLEGVATRETLGASGAISGISPNAAAGPPAKEI